MLWQFTFAFLRKRTINGTHVWGQLMRKRDAKGSWIYRELTEDEWSEYVSSEAW